MLSDVLTRDNARLSRPNAEPNPGALAIIEQLLIFHPEALDVADDCISAPSSTVEAYVQAGVAPATRRAYRADLEHFRAWGGSIPTTDDQIAAYIADHGAVLKVATLTRRLAAISIAHDARGLPNPVRSRLVRATMRGVRPSTGPPNAKPSRC